MGYLNDVREISKVEEVVEFHRGGQKDAGHTLMELNSNGDELIQHASLCLRVDPAEVRILRFEHLRVDRVQCVLSKDRLINNGHFFSSLVSTLFGKGTAKVAKCRCRRASMLKVPAL